MHGPPKTGLPAQLIVHGTRDSFQASSERLPHRPGGADEHPQPCRRRSDHGALELRICDDGHGAAHIGARRQPPVTSQGPEVLDNLTDREFAVLNL